MQMEQKKENNHSIILLETFYNVSPFNVERLSFLFSFSFYKVIFRSFLPFVIQVFQALVLFVIYVIRLFFYQLIFCQLFADGDILGTPH